MSQSQAYYAPGSYKNSTAFPHDFLQKQESHQLFTRENIPDQHNPQPIPQGPNMIWQADLMDMQNYAHENNGMHYILVCTDTFNKKLYAETIPDKTKESVLTAFKKITANNKPRKIFADRGSEFTNNEMQYFSTNSNIKWAFTGASSMHAPQVERAIRTLRTGIQKNWHDLHTLNYTSFLQAFIDNYNNTPQTTTGIAPNNARGAETEIHTKLTERAQKLFHYTPPLKVGQRVRFKINRNTFDKGTNPSYSYQTYTITKVIKPSYDYTHFRYQLTTMPVDAYYSREQLLPVDEIESSPRAITRSRLRAGKTLEIKHRQMRI